MTTSNLHHWLISWPAFVGKCAAALAICAACAQAAGLEVSPTHLHLSAPQRASGITLQNIGAEPLRAQVRVFAWFQKDNTDYLSPTTELTISPPMLMIAPGHKQLLRVIRTSAAPTGTPGEQTYRIIIDELPQPLTQVSSKSDSNAATAKSPQTGLQFLMRYSLPVFVGSPVDSQIAKQLSYALDKTGTPWTLQVRNAGSSHAQIADVQAVLEDGSRVVLASGLLGYVLAGQTMRWSVQTPRQEQSFVGYEAMINRETQPIDVSTL